ncbi:MAG: alanyl-tRNA editing protein [Elioraea sp.]|nr:alanyl-tRNA editing protein [Elioraea sp.]MDW8445293.1 alanyl-tRNA editing protein [Acetobacteraceae bacterium]
MTELLFRADAYRAEAAARVVAVLADGVVLDRTVFYAAAGGQPGDVGTLRRADGSVLSVIDTVRAENGAILHRLAEGTVPPEPGEEVTALIDWPRRYRLMRMHTALHLLCALLPGAAVTGGAIGDGKGRLDFDLPSAPDREALNDGLARLIAEDHPVGESWITEAELDANPHLVRTLSVKPPRGTGRVRLVRIGTDERLIDLQPCGGTHVRSTGEIGRVAIAKVENKGRQNRRIALVLEA